MSCHICIVLFTSTVVLTSAKYADGIAQNGPSDDSLRMYKFLQLYQQQQQRIANSKAQYANRLSSGYNLAQQRQAVVDDDGHEYELFHSPNRWNAKDLQRYRKEEPRLRQLPSEIGVERVKSESPSGYISVQVYPPQEEKDENGYTPTSGETESNTVNTEYLHEEKKSPQKIGSEENRIKSFAANFQDENGPLALRHSSDNDLEKTQKNPFSDIYFIVIVAGCSAAAIFGVIAAGYCFYKFQKTSKAAAEVDYPAYGVTGPSKEHVSPSGDRKLAHSAQMYHYQHQKQQMIAVENATTNRQTSNSDVDSEEENEEGDYTVYECPGLAPTGEMEVKNPLFHDDSTPMSPPVSSKDIKKP